MVVFPHSPLNYDFYMSKMQDLGLAVLSYKDLKFPKITVFSFLFKLLVIE